MKFLKKKRNREEEGKYHGGWLNATNSRIYTADGLINFGKCDGMLVSVFLVARGGRHDNDDRSALRANQDPRPKTYSPLLSAGGDVKLS